MNQTSSLINSTFYWMNQTSSLINSTFYWINQTSSLINSTFYWINQTSSLINSSLINSTYYCVIFYMHKVKQKDSLHVGAHVLHHSKALLLVVVIQKHLIRSNNVSRSNSRGGVSLVATVEGECLSYGIL